MKTSVLVVAFALLLAAAIARAAPSDPVRSITLPQTQIELKAGEGKTKTEGFCAICHSLDYITMQPPFSRGQWTGTVNKMIKVFGAPIPDEEAGKIIDYLAGAYGTGK
jgi:cytochrome c5